MHVHLLFVLHSLMTLDCASRVKQGISVVYLSIVIFRLFASNILNLPSQVLVQTDEQLFVLYQLRLFLCRLSSQCDSNSKDKWHSHGVGRVNSTVGIDTFTLS